MRLETCKALRTAQQPTVFQSNEIMLVHIAPVYRASATGHATKSTNDPERFVFQPFMREHPTGVRNILFLKGEA